MMFHYECSACGAKFSTAVNEARHRHNFPALCKRNKRFTAWETQRQMHYAKRRAIAARIEAQAYANAIIALLRAHLPELMRLFDELVRIPE